MKLQKFIGLALCFLLVAQTIAPLSVAHAKRRTSVAVTSKNAVSTHRSTAPRTRATARTTRVTGVSKASRTAVRRTTVVHSRTRVHRGVVVVRPHGHYYHGYGHYHGDDDAWKWLALTAITLKLLDNLNEQQQREHEAAQVEATTAEIGESITWSDGSASGSVTATREGTDAAGNQCREFQQDVTIGGETEQAYGTACLQPDGSWKIQE